jgi:hypothetical protein
MAKIQQYGTVADIFEILRSMNQGISENMIRRHIQSAGIQKTPKTGKYNVAKVLEAIKTNRERDNKNVSGPQGTLKSKKTNLECEILRLKIEEMRGLSISVEDHLREMREMQGHWNATLDHFVSEASALTKDRHLVDRLGLLVSNTRKMLVARIEACELQAEGAGR